jgi:hypothetical protein
MANVDLRHDGNWTHGDAYTGESFEDRPPDMACTTHNVDDCSYLES